MSEIISQAFLIALVTAGIRMATPLTLAALGEVFAERSGILNLGIEGIMTAAAFSAYVITLYTGSVSTGVLFGMIVGAGFGLFMALLSITLCCNQVVSGLGLYLAGMGITGLLFLGSFGAVAVPERIPVLQSINIPLLSEIPVLGPIVFSQNLLVYLTFILAIICEITLFKTTAGLKIRAVGEYPHAADALGINVYRVRYLCTIFGGMTAGLAGAYLSLEMGFFREYMVAGRGWIAIAIVIFSGWRPFRALLGALLFGMVDGLQMRLGALGYFTMEYQFLRMLPYIAVIVALISISTKKVRGPAALGVPFKREKA